MKNKPRGLSNTVRIIGGKWRGKKLAFPSVQGLRPTPDRIRETVFNWLQFELRGARVLDLFAGSGAFGLEALSRGAAYVIFVDKDDNVVKQLRSNLREIDIENADVKHSDAIEYLQHKPDIPFDVVFLDPPYGKHLVERSVAALEENSFLTSNAYIYIEAESELKDLDLPPGWKLHRSKRTGQVGYHLAVKKS